MVQRDYLQHIESVAKKFADAVESDEARAVAADELRKYRDGFAGRTRAWMNAKGNTSSWMVTGRGGRTAAMERTNQKRIASEDKRRQELVDWQTSAQARAMKNIRAGITKSTPRLDALHKAASAIFEGVETPEGYPAIPGVSEIVLPGGLRAKIETPKGAYRSGVDTDGNAWSVQMPAHYGEIVGTMGTDGDPLDVFVGESLGAPYVYVVGLRDPSTGEHDEDKVFFGFPHREAAMGCYREAYNRRDLTLDVRRLTVPEFQTWLANHGVRGVRVDGRPMRKGLDMLRECEREIMGQRAPMTSREVLYAATEWRWAPDRLRGREGGARVPFDAVAVRIAAAPPISPHAHRPRPASAALVRQMTAGRTRG